MQKLTLKVPTISCEGCVQNIARALKRREGVIKVEGDPKTKEVTVSYQKEKIVDDEIRKAILQIGHELG